MLRNEIFVQEQILRSHYEKVFQKVNPIIQIANLVSGNKIFNRKYDEDVIAGDKSDVNWLETLMKIFTATAAGGILFTKSRKNFGKAILAYAMEQGLKFITDKDITEHIEKIKEWLKKKEKNTDETDDEQT